MMPCSPSQMSGGHTAPLLVSLAFGYAVLVLAKREGKPLNLLGKIIGWLIIVVSFVGLLCTATCGLYRLCPRHQMDCGQSAMGCPFSHHRSPCMAPEKMGQAEDEDDEKGEGAAPIEKK